MNSVLDIVPSKPRAIRVSGAVATVRRRLASPGWTVVLATALVLLAGSRLVVLSMQQHAQQARAAAQAFADRTAHALETQLRAMHDLAARRALLPPGATPGVFWLTADGAVMDAPAPDRAVVGEIAAEWKSQPAGMTTDILGPIRAGSQLWVAVRAPLGAGSSGGWSVAFRDLDSLLLAARLDQAARAGYEFELTRFDPDSGRMVGLTATAQAPLSQPVTAAILPDAPPAGMSASIVAARAPALAWQLGIAPRAGWFPATDLVIDVSLLILVTWLVALGVRDTMRHMGQLRSALAVSRQRLQRSQLRLAEEVELRAGLQQRFEHAHYHDSVTGLPNRHYFIDQLDRVLRAMRTSKVERNVALLLISIDRYRVITDTVGHTAGDELMVQITRLFDQALSSHEHVLARWSEDELALLLTDAADAESVMSTARALQQTLQNPIELRRNSVSAATTIGASFVDSGLQRPEQVLREADLALSRAKSQGGASLVTYNSAMQAQLLQAVSLEADLHAALQRGEFRLLFQPIVALKDRRIVGVEVLLRWLHPVEGLLTPSRFLSLAEDAGLIVPITRWIILRVCQLSREWRPRVPSASDLYLSINLSPAALLDPGLTDYIFQVLRETGTAPSSLKFELTENGLVNHVGAARRVLDRLHSMGCELMLDDFGTAYSSLSHLQLFPFDYLKIDSPIDGRFGADPANEALMRAMAQMASTLGLKTIAEIVETPAAAKALEQIGCEFGQGNAFCAPLDIEQLLRRLRSPILEPCVGGQPDEEQTDSPTMILPVLAEEDLAAIAERLSSPEAPATSVQ